MFLKFTFLNVILYRVPHIGFFFFGVVEVLMRALLGVYCGRVLTKATEKRKL